MTNQPYDQAALAPGQSPFAAAAAKPKKPFYQRWWFITLAVIVGIAVLVNLAGGNKGNDQAVPKTTAPAASQSPAEKQATSQPPAEKPAGLAMS